MRNKKSVHILFTATLLLFCGYGWSQSANIVKSEYVPYEMKSEKEIMAYNNKVVAKVKDFYNYLEIISNPEVERGVREHTVTLAKKMFLNNVEVVNFLSNSTERIELEQLLDQLIASNKKMQFSVSDITVSPGKFDQDITYNLLVKRGGNKVNYRLKQLSFIYIMNKKFGNKSKEVAITSLGEISN